MQKLRWSDVLTFVLFLVLATILWFGHAMESVRNTRVPVTVHYTGVPGKLAFEKPLPDTLWIEVRDAGKRLRGYHDGLHLNVDLSHQLSGNRGTVLIANDVLRRSVTDLLLGTSKLISISPEQLEGTYHAEQSRWVPVVLQGQGEPASEYMLMGQPSLSQTQVTIYGARGCIDTLSAIYTEPLRATGLRDSVTLRLALTAPRGVRLSADSVDVSLFAVRCTEKVLRAHVQTQRVPAGEHLRVFPNEVEVTVRVPIDRFAEVSDDDIQALCTYPSVPTDRLDIELRSYNDHVLGMRANPDQLEFIIEKEHQPSEDKQ